MSHCSSCGAPSDAQERIRELEGACAEMRAQIRNALLCSHHGDAYQYMQKALSSSAGTGWLSPQEADALRQELAEQKKALAEEVAFRLVVEARNLQLEAENKQLGMAEQDNERLRGLLARAGIFIMENVPYFGPKQEPQREILAQIDEALKEKAHD